MNKRFGILLLAVLLCFAACGDGGKDTTCSTITVEIGMIELEEIQDDPMNYVITLLEVGPYETTVIDTYRRASGCKLSEAIHAVKSAPCTVIEVTNKKDAELIAATFTDHGATVEITELE